MTRTSGLHRDDAILSIHDEGTGAAVLFQHGLGGNEAQVAQTFPEQSGWRRITTECRGHGGSTLGTVRPFSISMLASDVVAALDERGIDRFVAGGISMGAAIALHLAKACPDRVTGLILVRPAWTFSPGPENLAPIREIAALLQSHPVEEARSVFARSATADRMRLQAPDNLTSLLGYFDRNDAGDFADVLGDIASDGTGVTREDLQHFEIPALVLGNERDAIHPLDVARQLAEALPRGGFREVPAKATNAQTHFAAVQAAILQFLDTQIQHRSPERP